MRLAKPLLCAVLLCLGACATGGTRPDSKADAGGVAAHRAWWQAYTTGDRDALDAHTAGSAEAVFSSGVRLDRAGLLQASASNRADSGLTLAWSEESVQVSRGGLAVVRATSTERVGASEQVFRIVTVIDRAGRSDWQMRFAQSTRVARFAPAVPAAVAGPLSDYAGGYTTPKGRRLGIEVRGDALWMIEPSGKAIGLTPTGPGLFEPTGQSPLNGVLRLVFARGPSGKVASLSRIVEGQVDTFPRTD